MKEFSSLPQPVRLAIFFVIAVILLLIIAYVYNKFKAPANAAYVAGGGQIPSGWTPTSITDGLYNVIDGIFTTDNTKENEYALFNQLNDNQMIAVYNDWQNRYSTQKSYYLFTLGSLTQALAAETYPCTLNIGGGVCNYDIMTANLQRLKLP